MTYLKKSAEVVAGLMLLVGFFFLLGTAGASDYANEVGECFNIVPCIPYIISGVLMIGCGVMVLKWIDNERTGEEDDN